MDYKLNVKKKAASTYSEVDLFDGTIIDFSLDFYNVDNIDQLRVPTSVSLTLPMTDNNVSVIDYDPRGNTYTTLPTNAFDFQLYLDNSVVLEGNLYVESYQFNNLSPVLNIRLVDKIQDIFNTSKSNTLTSMYSDQNSIVSFSQFLSNQSGAVGTDPTLQDVMFPYVDFCNDTHKFGYAQRQFIQFGFDKDRAGFVPALQVKSFVNRFFTTAGSSVTSRFFELGNYGNPISGNNPDDLYMLIPSSLQAGSRTRTRGMVLIEGPYEYFVNEFTQDADPAVTNAREMSTYPDPTYGWNYNGTPSSNTVDTGFGLNYTTNVPNTGLNTTAAYFGSHMSYKARPTATARNIQPNTWSGYEMSMIKSAAGEYSMVWRIFPATSTAKVNINAVLWKDGTPFERFRMHNTDGTIKELNVSDAGVTAMKTQNIYFEGMYNGQPRFIDNTSVNMMGNFQNLMFFNDGDIGDFIWEQKKIDIDAGSTYAVTMEFEWLEGEIDVEYVSAWTEVVAGNPSSGIKPSGYTRRMVASDDVAKAAYWEKPTLIGQLYLTLASVDDHNPYFLDDDINTYWALDNVDITPFDMLKEIIARFNLSAVYDQNSDTVLIDRLPDIRESNSLDDITDKVDNTRFIQVDVVTKIAKSIEIETSKNDLFFDTYGYDKKDLNPAGSDDIKFSLSSRFYNQSLCGDETFIEIPEGFNEYEIGFTENSFTKMKDVGLVFGYIDTPNYISNVKRAKFVEKGSYKGLIYETLTGHIFPRFTKDKTGSLPLYYFDEQGGTTDLYDFFVGNDNIAYYSKPKVKFSALMDSDYAFDIKNNYAPIEMAYVTSNNMIIKSFEGKMFDGGIYGEVEAIIL